MSILAFLHRVAEGQNLSREEAFEAMQTILAGLATPVQMAAITAFSAFNS